MSEVYYDFSILIQDESTALDLSEKLHREQKACDYELITLINTSLKTQIEAYDFAYHIDTLKTFKNEVQINCYSGRSEPPVIVVDALAKTIKGTIIKLSETYDDVSKPIIKYFLDGKKATKKAYEQAYKKHKIEDDTDKLQRYLSNCNFASANKIVNKCELDRIQPEDGYLFELIQSPEYVALAQKLLQAGLFNHGDSVYQSPWMGSVAQYGSTKLLQAFIEQGLDPYDTGEGQETALHSCLNNADKYSLSNIQYLIKTCSQNLDLVTEYGSPLWFGFEEKSNIPGCLLFERAGATAIPPIGFYEGKTEVDILLESIKHRDETTFKQYYTDAFYDLSVYHALRHQAYPMLIWLNNEKTIDWQITLSDKLTLDTRDALDQYYLAKPLYEIPFALVDGGGCDSRVLDFIIDHVASNNDTNNKIYNLLAVYIAGFNHLPESVQLLQKLKQLGAQFNVTSTVDDEDDSALYRALMHECLENLDYLLQIGASIPNGEELGIESIEEYIEDYFEGDVKIKAVALLEKHGLT